LESIFNISTTRKRTQQSFYALWYFLSKINFDSIKENKKEIRTDLKKLFISMNLTESKEKFDQNIDAFWNKYKK